MNLLKLHNKLTNGHDLSSEECAYIKLLLPPCSDHPKWCHLKIGTLFRHEGSVLMKVRDTGYLFGIANSIDYNGKWTLVPTEEEVEIVDEWDI